MRRKPRRNLDNELACVVTSEGCLYVGMIAFLVPGVYYYTCDSGVCWAAAASIPRLEEAARKGTSRAVATTADTLLEHREVYLRFGVPHLLSDVGSR